MINLIRGEFYKLFRSKVFVVLLFLSILFGIGSVMLTQMTMNMFKEMDPVSIEQMDKITESTGESQIGISFSSNMSYAEYEELYSNYNGVKNFETSFGGNTFQVFILILTSMFIVIEFTTGSMKQIVSKGFSRTKILLAKFITLSVANILIMVLIVLLSFLIGGLHWGFGDIDMTTISQMSKLLGIQILGVIGYTALTMMIAYLFRSNAACITINFVVIMFSGLLIRFLELIFKHSEIGPYWILNSIMSMNRFFLPGAEYLKSFLVITITGVICTLVSIFRFKRLEIK